MCNMDRGALEVDAVKACFCLYPHYTDAMSIVDAHAHIASWRTLEQSKRNLLLGMDRHGVDIALVSNADCSSFPEEGKSARKPIPCEQGLREVLEFAKETPGRIYAAVWVTPLKSPRPSEELIRLIEDNKTLIKALKLHPFCEKVPADSPLMEPYYDLAKHYGLPILVHTAVDEESSIGHLVGACLKHPELSFVAAHMELCSAHAYSFKMMKQTPNLCADTAWVDLYWAKRVLLEVGPDRVMFGTDAPIDGEATLDNPMYRAYFENRDGLEETLWRRLLGQNAIDLYRLEN